MATKPSDDGQGKQQEVIDELQKAGTLKRSTVVHVSPAESKETVVNQPDCVNPNGWKPLALEERRIVLSDNTQIIVESQNEFIFIGPDSNKIVLSCLPLFCVPDQVAQDSTVSSLSVNQSSEKSGLPSSSSESSLQKNNGWISFTQSITKQNSLTKLPVPSEEAVSNTDSIGETDLPPVDQELPGDLFTIVDPFEGQPTDSFTGGFEDSTRNKQIDDAFAKATKPGATTTAATSNGGGDDGGGSDSDDDNLCNNGDDTEGKDIQINYVSDVKAVSKLRSASVSFVTMNQVSRSKTMIATPLPPPPPTVFPRYTERGGWLIKLSHQKGMFGDRWQKRYFILNGPRLSYFKKYGDSQPRGVVNMIPGSWCRSIPQGTPRMSDAVAKSNRSGVITVNRCLAVHKPSNYASTLSAMVASEGVADAFNSQTIALSNPQDSSRTFYMIAASEQERHAWISAINENIDAYKRSQEALDVACGELRNILKAVGSCVPVEDLPSILLAVHSKKAAMFNVSPT